jgi:hypothetical protein
MKINMENALFLMAFGWSMTILAGIAFFILWQLSHKDMHYWKQKCIDGCKTKLSHYGLHQPDDLDT